MEEGNRMNIQFTQMSEDESKTRSLNEPKYKTIDQPINQPIEHLSLEENGYGHMYTPQEPPVEA